MRVNDNGPNGLHGTGPGGGVGGASKTQQPTPVGPGQGTQGGRRTDGDQVQLSNLGQALQAADVESPERLERIAALRADVRAGRYAPDPAAVSRSIVSDALGEPQS